MTKQSENFVSLSSLPSPRLYSWRWFGKGCCYASFRVKILCVNLRTVEKIIGLVNFPTDSNGNINRHVTHVPVGQKLCFLPVSFSFKRPMYCTRNIFLVIFYQQATDGVRIGHSHRSGRRRTSIWFHARTVRSRVKCVGAHSLNQRRLIN